SVPYPTLSEYNFFEGDLANHEPVYGVLPYEPISTLFTDYAHKKRFVWMPYGVKASYNGDGNILEFPNSTVLIKTFYYDNVLPSNTTKIIETRLLIKKQDEWIYADYIWDEEQQEALLNKTGFGFNVDIEWLQNGETKSTIYRIPSIEECFLCHKRNYKEKLPIGPKPQNLNSNYTYPEGIKNQLQKWIEMGYLDSVPSTITTVVDWEDTSNPLDLRVRSYLDINCAHCHVEGGHCAARDIRLAFNESSDLENLGVCVTPESPIVGLDNTTIMVPGDAENSIFYYRVNTTEEELRMPMAGRTLIHEEFAEILKEYINSLTITCD
ncbi:MAG: hypothetical protein KDC91_08995, partial [Flavobacteriaceae bacterium]|nr:hypothetical protein [Flavobacteriaceae bacterium]